MTDYELVKKEEERLNKKYEDWSKIEKINFIFNNNLSTFSTEIDELFFKIDNEINNVLTLKNDIDNQEYGYITFNQLISLMKINYENNIAKFNLSKLSLMYPSVCPYLLEYPLDYIEIHKQDGYVKIIMNYLYKNESYVFSHSRVINICKNKKTNLYYISCKDLDMNNEKELLKALDCEKIYNYFLSSDANKSITGIYNNDINVEVPIDITDSSVILGEIINNEYGIGYLYSITDNDILKITHKPNIKFKDKYNMIKAINVNDSNFKDHILINISDLPMQYLKYLDVLNKLEKNKKLSKSIVKEKRKIRDLFRIRKKNDR